jgi:cytochrome P450
LSRRAIAGRLGGRGGLKVRRREDEEGAMNSQRVETWVPDHVPEALAWDQAYNDFTASGGDDPFLTLSALHDGPGMLWCRRIDPWNSGWLPTRHALIREVLTDSETFSSVGDVAFMSAIGLDWRLVPLEYDPPDHHLYRKALEPFFSPSAVNEMDGAVRAICDQLIDGFGGPACEFIGEFAEKFPSYVFLDIMGMPRERLPQFLEWERGMLHGQTRETQAEAMAAILAYLQEFIRDQRDAPTSALMKSVMSARYNDRPLTETEILSICYVMYIGGLDTVYSTLGWILWSLARDQPLQDRLRAHPEDMTKAIDELLRAFSVTGSQRRVARDVDFHGVQLRKGDRVLIALALAGRDPAVYADPHVVDIDRPVRHIAFGTGAHTCLGLRLAKREIRIVLESFLSRFRRIRIPDGARHAFHTGVVIGIDRLPLAWDPI